MTHESRVPSRSQEIYRAESGIISHGAIFQGRASGLEMNRHLQDIFVYIYIRLGI